MDEDLDLNEQNDEYDDEPLFADDIEDNDDIPPPPKWILLVCTPVCGSLKWSE